MGLVLVHPFDRSISKFRGNEPEGTNGIVVARNDKIDVVRIAVGIDNGNRRNTQLFCLAMKNCCVARAATQRSSPL